MAESLPSQRLGRAVYNNAVWCDTVCRAHGCPGEFSDGLWISRRETPRFYPNAVTLVPGREAEHLRILRALVDLGIPGAWAIKDSYNALDPRPLGFEALFDASWIWRDADIPGLTGDTRGVRWARITDASALADWETAWDSDPGGPEARPGRVFAPDLLAAEDVSIVAGFQDAQIVAGAIGNRAGGAIGISNLFVRADDGYPLRAACIGAVIATFPGLPLVGYETGPELAAARAMGFEVLGSLRVWIRTPSAPPLPIPAAGER